MSHVRLFAFFVAASAALAAQALAADTLKLAVGQRGLWDSSFGEAGQQNGIFQTQQQLDELLQLPKR